MSKIYININILREFMWFISHCLQNPECILHLQLTTMWTRHISRAQFLHVAHGSCVGKHSFVVKVFIVSYLFKSQVIYSKGCEVMANTLDSAPFSTIDIQVILGQGGLSRTQQDAQQHSWSVPLGASSTFLPVETTKKCLRILPHVIQGVKLSPY